MTIQPQTLYLLPQVFAICRLETESALPHWLQADHFFSITSTPDELSIVCLAESVPIDVQADRSWRCFKLQGPFEFSLTGILNSVTIPLSDADIGIFAVSTYDTDYVLVKEDALQQALSVLKDAGHTLHLDS